MTQTLDAEVRQTVQRPLTDATALSELNAAVQALPSEPYREFSGRGIVICAGGLRYFVCAWVCIKMLRHHGCTLPIEVWHLGDNEMNDGMRRLLSEHGATCVDALQVRKSQPVRTLNGWELKPYAIMHSSFQEVLLLDADNVVVKDPTYLFESPEYQVLGAVFWPDYGRLGKDRMIWQVTGVPYRDEPEFESGQIIVNKSRCWPELSLTMWINEHSDFFYRHIHGDKETFHIAWRKLERDYAMPRRGIHALNSTMCQHDFQGERVFQHRNFAKWTLRSNARIKGFLGESECLMAVDELVPHWHEVAGISVLQLGKCSSVEHEAARSVIERKWTYERIGYDKRGMTFSADGCIVDGAADFERFWNVKAVGQSVVLIIQSHESMTCELLQGRDGVWRGRWSRFEKMPIELRPQTPAPHLTTLSQDDPSTDFSQWGEQQHVLEVFRESPSGYLVDIGAGDGVTDSNTRALLLQGWSGLLVEPVPEEYWRLEDACTSFSAVEIINAAVAQTDGYGEMWVARPDKRVGHRRDNRHTLDAKFAEGAAAHSTPALYDIRTVRVISARTLMARLPSKNIEFLSVDAEGLDCEIICDLFELGLRPQLLVYERDKHIDKIVAMEERLVQWGYVEAFRTRVNIGWRYSAKVRE